MHRSFLLAQAIDGPPQADRGTGKGGRGMSNFTPGHSTLNDIRADEALACGHHISLIVVDVNQSAMWCELCKAQYAGNLLNALIVKAQQYLARYIVPDSGISDAKAIGELLGIFDGLELRIAQAEWNAALAK